MCEGTGEQVFSVNYGKMVQRGQWKKNTLQEGKAYKNETRQLSNQLGASILKKMKEANHRLHENCDEEEEKAQNAKKKVITSYRNYGKMKKLFGLKRSSQNLGSQFLRDCKSR